MLKLSDRVVSKEFDCPYLPGRMVRNEHFCAMDLNGEELGDYLQTGWRKFGIYYFRPVCDNCKACTPLRVLANDFHASRSQRKVLNKNNNPR